jgi:hypothetical protein
VARTSLANLPPKRGGRSPYSVITVMNPGKGLNSLISDNLINDQEASSLENIMYVESGCPAKAYGYTNVGSGLSNNPRGLGFYNDTIAGSRYLLTVDGTALKYLSGSTWTTLSGASFSSTSTDKISFTQARGSIYIMDGQSAIAKIATGLTLTRNGHAPKAKFSIFYQGRHFAAGVDGQPNRLYISKTTDASEFTVTTGGTQPQPDNSNDADSGAANVPGATAFSADAVGNTDANVIDINKFDGDKITALAKYQDALIIFKERSIYQMTLDSTGVPIIAPVSKSYGCVGHKSVDNVENDIMFLTRNGVYVLGNEPNYFNVVRTNELSSRIHTEIDAINPTNYTNATALFNQYVFYMGIPSGGVTANNVSLTYDRRFLAWSKLTHIQPESFCLFTDSTNVDAIYFTSSGSANVYKMTTNYDSNGAAISAQWTSKAFDLSDFAGYKRWISCTILFRQLVGTVNIDFYTDNGTLSKSTSITSSTSGGLGTNVLGGGDELGGQPSSASGGTVALSSTNIPYRVRLGVKSRNIKVKISNGRINETFVVLGIEFQFRKYSKFVFPSALKIQ